MRRITIYGNGAAGNHGCEAISRSLRKILTGVGNLYSASFNVEEDIKYGIDDIVQLFPLAQSPHPLSCQTLLYRLLQHVSYSDKRYYRYIFRRFINNVHAGDIYLSAGGDNYSYNNDCWLQVLNESITKRGGITALVGCSIADEIKDDRQFEDLSRYHTIIARETITQQALLNAGVKAKIYCAADPAFQLGRIDLLLPDGFEPSNTIGINISPMIIERESKKGATLQSYVNLITHILSNTDMHVALIPHVVWKQNDDRQPLNALYSQFKNDSRVVLIGDHNAMELKGYIARCRFMVAARTHASIAAYSQQVPTLVVGYSVKARGIAQDIFGTYENYVVPVQSLSDGNELVDAVNWIINNEKVIRDRYRAFMPQYAASALKLNEIISGI